MGYVYTVSSEEMRKIESQPAVSKEFLDKCKEVSKKYKKINTVLHDCCISDCLYIGVDFAPNDDGMLVVMRREGIDTYVVNQFRNDEALELYNKLIGVK